MTKQELWKQMQDEWPELAEFLCNLKKELMQAESVQVKKWPNEKN